MKTATEIYKELGKKSKLALAARDEREQAYVFGSPRIYDADVSNRVLALCDRYASKVRK